MAGLGIMKKNICMIVYTDYARDTRVRREAETLAALPDYQVTVLALKFGWAPRSYDLYGVRVVEMNERKYRGKKTFRYVLSYIKFLMLSLVACTRLFLLRQVDIIHVHNMPNFLVLAGIVPRVLGKKLILDIHDTVPETYLAKFNTSSYLLFKLLCFEEFISCALAHRIICVNHVQRNVLVKRRVPLDKIAISMNVPDDNRFNLKDIKNTHQVRNSTFKMIYHGTVTKRLGVDLIIQAVAHLTERIDNVELHIWGYGDDQEDFVRLSEELNVQDSVYFNREGVPLDRLPSELSNMDLGVVGNRKNVATELMLPVKMLECVALGIPVVVPRLRCIEYYFSDNMVSYFEPEDVNSMVSAILKLYKYKSMRKTQAEKARTFLDQYGWEKHQLDLVGLYESL